METERPSLAEQLRVANVIEIPIPGYEEVMTFRKVNNQDFITLGLIPTEIFKIKPKPPTPAEAQRLMKRHIEGTFTEKKATAEYARVLAGFLIRCSIAPKIVLDGQVRERKKEISVGELGDLKDYLFAQLFEKSGLGEEAQKLAPFRGERQRPSAGRSRKKVRTKAKHPAER